MIVYPHYISNCSQWNAIDETNSHVVTAGRSYAELFWSYFGLQQADHMPNYSDLISGYSRPISIPHLAKRVWLLAKPPWLQAK